MSKYIKSIGLLLVLLIVFLFLKNEYSRLLLRDASYGMPALIKRGEVDNLYLGSSMFRQGLDINVMEKDSEESHYILAYNGNQPVMELIELQYLLENGVSIKNLYLDMYAYSLAAMPDISDEKLFLETDLRTKNKFWQLLDDKSVSRAWSMYVSSNNEQLLSWPVSAAIINNQFRSGGTLLATEGMEGEAYENLSIPADNIDINDEQLRAVEEIIKLCVSNNIDLHFIDTPKSRVVYENEAYRKVMDKFEELLISNNVDYMRQGKEYEFDVNTSNNFMDAVHLSSIGREVFTQILVK